MYPRQLYQAQQLYNTFKDDLVGIKTVLFDELSAESSDSIDSYFVALVIQDIAYILRKFNIGINATFINPESFYVAGFLCYFIDKSHLIGSLQNGNEEAKQKLSNFFSSAANLKNMPGLLSYKLASRQLSYHAKRYNDFLSAFIEDLINCDKKTTGIELTIALELTNEINTRTFGNFKLTSAPVVLNNEIKKQAITAQPVTIEQPTTKESLADILNELKSYIGLENIKKDIQSLVNVLKIQKQRENQGLTTVKPTLHMVFMGPPGTGKTTIARLIGRIFKAMGLLSKGHMVETDRSGLVAGYVGQTAIKVDEVIKKAIDGVLFIDEAYTLSSGDTQDSFGQEAIDTLLKRMEDLREKMVVIVAGYNSEMQQFISSNPGLKSRFNKYIYFEDYKPEELLSIFNAMAESNSYVVSSGLKSALLLKFEELYNARTKSFGNGRLVRNLLDKTIENQSNRLASEDKDYTSNELQLLLPDDAPL